MTAKPITLTDIEAAQTIIKGRILRTPMLPAPRLSELTGADIFVKYENLQVTNSFKERGALNKLASLDSDDRKRGVIAMSAGNHAQAVAYHARRLGIDTTIVMPLTTPAVHTANGVSRPGANLYPPDGVWTPPALTNPHLRRRLPADRAAAG